MITLKPRLRAVADLVRNGSVLADVGTDHAYLPAALLSEGVVPYALVADINAGPLENARATITRCGLLDRTEFFLSDGLKNVPVERADDIVIAGMGGILISEILGACPEVRDSGKKLILQPQSHDEDVRRRLFSDGFEITEEKACFEDDKVYICLSAVYTGVCRDTDRTTLIFGSFLNNKDEASAAFAGKKLQRLKTRCSALAASRPEDPSLEWLPELIKNAEDKLNANSQRHI